MWLLFQFYCFGISFVIRFVFVLGNRREWLLLHVSRSLSSLVVRVCAIWQSIAFRFLAFLSFLSPDWFFCSILRNSWHTLPPPVCFGHVSALCSQTHRPLHITVVPVESGCKIPRKPKIWKRREESIIKLQRIERSAKLRMSCRRRPTDSLSLDKSMNFCMSATHFISVWTLAWASNTRRW